MQALILCGGQGTRLRAVIGERQKTMTDISGSPFLLSVIEYLQSYNVNDIIFAVGYKSNEVIDYFGNGDELGIKAQYAIENEPLGTGGAIRNAISLINDDYVMVLNGDTLFPIDVNVLEKSFINKKADLMIALKRNKEKERYGTVVAIDDGDGVVKKIVEFKEKVVLTEMEQESELFKREQEITFYEASNLYINGGIYIMSKNLIKTIIADMKVSLEQILFPKWIKENRKIYGITYDNDFIDIGTEESLKQYKNECTGF